MIERRVWGRQILMVREMAQEVTIKATDTGIRLYVDGKEIVGMTGLQMAWRHDFDVAHGVIFLPKSTGKDQIALTLEYRR